MINATSKLKVSEIFGPAGYWNFNVADGGPKNVIYIIENTINGKKYVGKTTCGVIERWKTHLYELSPNRSKKSNSRLYNAMRKYGPNAFEIYVMESCPDNFSREQINNREKYWIQCLDPEYNMTKGGDGGLIGTGQLGKRWKIEDPSRMGKGNLGKKLPKDLISQLSGKNNYQFRGYVQTPWGIFESVQAAAVVGRSLKEYGISSLSESYISKSIKNPSTVYPSHGRRTPKDYKGLSAIEIGFGLLDAGEFV